MPRRCLALTWHTYYKWVPDFFNPVKLLVWTLAVIASVMLIVTRIHYTLDVVLAVFFSMTIWGSYHRLAADVALNHRFIAVWWVDQKILYPIMEYLELPLIGEVSKQEPKSKEDMNLFDLQLAGMVMDEQDADMEVRRQMQKRWARECIRSDGGEEKKE